MMIAAVVSSRPAPRMRPVGYAGSSSGLALDLRHDRDAGLEAGQAERELREHDQRDPDDDERGRRAGWSSALHQSSIAVGC